MLKPFESVVGVLFALAGINSFVEERALRSDAQIVSGTIVRYEPGDMGSSCPVASVRVNGRQAEVRTGECSSHPPAIGTPVSMLHGRAQDRFMLHTEGRPPYLFAAAFGLAAAFFFYLAWPGKGARAANEPAK